MRNKTVFLFSLAFIFISPVLAWGSNGRFEKRKFGSYTVFISESFDNGLGKLLIKKGNNKTYETSDFGDHYYFGNRFDEALNEKDPHSGRDVTGRGLPNLVISNWTGGAHCCHFLHVFELGNNLRRLVTVEANSSSVHLVDLDRDGFPEIEFEDGAIDYLFASFAGSPGGRVVLKFKKDRYEVATNLMSRPAPTSLQMARMKNKIRAAFDKNQGPDLPYDFLKAMMDLSYSGHFDLALRMASEVWPSTRSGLPEFKLQFEQALQKSLYWKNF